MRGCVIDDLTDFPPPVFKVGGLLTSHYFSQLSVANYTSSWEVNYGSLGGDRVIKTATAGEHELSVIILNFIPGLSQHISEYL